VKQKKNANLNQLWPVRKLQINCCNGRYHTFEQALHFPNRIVIVLFDLRTWTLHNRLIDNDRELVSDVCVVGSEGHRRRFSEGDESSECSPKTQICFSRVASFLQFPPRNQRQHSNPLLHSIMAFLFRAILTAGFTFAGRAVLQAYKNIVSSASTCVSSSSFFPFVAISKSIDPT
jgi:hypothetical protein